MSVQSYALVLTCKRCGHEVTPVAQGKPADGGQSIRATCECEECGARWLLAVQMVATALPTECDRVSKKRRAIAAAEERAAKERTLEFARSVGVA